MLSRTVVSVSAVSSTSSTSPSRFLCKVNPTIPKFLGLEKLSHNFTNCTTWNKNLNLNRKCSTRMDIFTTKASAAAQPLTNADELIGSVETFIFDCDGLCFSLALKFLVNSFLRIKKREKEFFFPCINEGVSDLQELYGKEINWLMESLKLLICSAQEFVFNLCYSASFFPFTVLSVFTFFCKIVGFPLLDFRGRD